jgi:hypothetical protein
MLFCTSGFVQVLPLATNRWPLATHARRASGGRRQLRLGSQPARSMSISCAQTLLRPESSEIGRPCNLNPDPTVCVVEQGPGERVAGMLGRQPIRSRAIVCSATLREGGRDESDMLACAPHPLRSKQACLPGPPARIGLQKTATHCRGGGREYGPRSRSFDSFLLLTPLGTQRPWLLGGGGEKGSRSHALEPPTVSPDLASLLFPSPAGSIRRDLCAPELSLAALAAKPVNAIKDKSLEPSASSLEAPSRRCMERVAFLLYSSGGLLHSFHLHLHNTVDRSQGQPCRITTSATSAHSTSSESVIHAPPVQTLRPSTYISTPPTGSTTIPQ